MTIQASTPTPNTPAAATTPASAPASEPTASSSAAPPAPKSRRAALADSLVAVDTGEGGDAPLEQPAAPTFTPNDPATPPPGEQQSPADRVAAIKAKLAKDREARAAKTQQDQLSTRAKTLETEIAELRAKPGLEAFVAEFKASPVATARKYGLNARQLLDQLTEDALAPGVAAQRAQQEQVDSEAKRAHERLDAYEAAEKQRAEVERLQKNARDYIAATAPSEGTKYPLLSKLPEARRLRLAQMAWSELQAEGQAEYDGELVAEYAESQLAEDQKHWSPALPPPNPAPTAPSSSTSAAPPSRAATKPPPRTLTPEITGASTASAQPRNAAERRKALEARLVAVETD